MSESPNPSKADEANLSDSVSPSAQTVAQNASQLVSSSPSQPASPPVSLRVEDLRVTYPNGHTAIYDVNFALEGGTVCALVGVNGSGKSTLFNAIMGIIRPQTGAVLLSGLPAQEAVRQNGVAYVPQSENIDWTFPVLVGDVVMQGRYGHMNFMRIARRRDREIVQAALKRLGVENLAQRQIGELSGGQKKRVFLARALAQESRIILLDEPFTGVDVKTEHAIMTLLAQLRAEGYLILVSTHNLGTVPDYCNEVVMINRTIIATGNTDAVYSQENLERTFGGILKHVRIPQAAPEAVTIVTDDERPAVFMGKRPHSADYGTGEERS